LLAQQQSISKRISEQKRNHHSQLEKLSESAPIEDQLKSRGLESKHDVMSKQRNLANSPSSVNLKNQSNISPVPLQSSGSIKK